MEEVTACWGVPPPPGGPREDAGSATTSCTLPWTITPGWPTWRSIPTNGGETTSAFLLRVGAFFAERGVAIEWVMTDNHLSYTRSVAFKEALATLGACHVLIPMYRPQVNGKVERFNRTLLTEWAYRRVYSSNRARLRDLPRWLEFYNSRRPHTALGGRPPVSRL